MDPIKIASPSDPRTDAFIVLPNGTYARYGDARIVRLPTDWEDDGTGIKPHMTPENTFRLRPLSV